MGNKNLVSLNPGKNIETHAQEPKGFSLRREQMKERRGIAERQGVVPAPLIVLAEGSQEPWVNRQAIDLACRCDVRRNREVRAAFLNHSSQTIDVVASGLAEAGYQHALVLPAMFVAGDEVAEAVAAAEKKTGVKLLLAKAMGLDRVVQFALQRALREYDNLVIYAPELSQEQVAQLDIAALIVADDAELATIDESATVLVLSPFRIHSLNKRLAEKCPSGATIVNWSQSAVVEVLLTRMGHLLDRTANDWVGWKRFVQESPFKKTDMRKLPPMII